MSEPRLILVDRPAPGVQVVTLNRPEKRNAIDNPMRAELLAALQRADGDAGVRVSIVRGAGPCFSSGYDLKSDLGANQPYFTPNVGLQWARHVSEGWMSLWDLAKPVIAMIHGYAMAGGLELAGACDLAYAAATRAPLAPRAALRGPARLRVVPGAALGAPRDGAARRRPRVQRQRGRRAPGS